MYLIQLFTVLSEVGAAGREVDFHHRFCDAIDEKDPNFRYVILKLAKEYGSAKIMVWTAHAIETLIESTDVTNSLGGMLLQIAKRRITKVKWNEMFKKDL